MARKDCENWSNKTQWVSLNAVYKNKESIPFHSIHSSSKTMFVSSKRNITKNDYVPFVRCKIWSALRNTEAKMHVSLPIPCPSEKCQAMTQQSLHLPSDSKAPEASVPLLLPWPPDRLEHTPSTSMSGPRASQSPGCINKPSHLARVMCMAVQSATSPAPSSYISPPDTERGSTAPSPSHGRASSLRIATSRTCWLSQQQFQLRLSFKTWRGLHF